MHLLIAFDKFKHSMSAVAACEAAAAGARAALGTATEITCAPLTDGGEGFCTILTDAAGGHLEFHRVTGPLGVDLDAPLGWVDPAKLPIAARRSFPANSRKLAIIEMAACAGLELVPPEQRHPKHCTTRGVGELIRIATASGADAILLGIGGSATSDLGLGALEALDLSFDGLSKITPEQWPKLRGFSGSLLEVPPIFVACDVENPLSGDNGAAAVYGPQKGLRPEEVRDFDSEATRIADELCRWLQKPQSLAEVPGCGAAGGLGFGLKAAFDAEFIPGFDLVARWLDLDAKIAAADLMITGEGKFDLSSLSGKGPFALAKSAAKKGKRTLLLAGATEKAAIDGFREQFPVSDVYSITPEGCPLEKALNDAPLHLRETLISVLEITASHDY